MTTPPLLEIADLRVHYMTRRGAIEAVRGVDLALGREKLAIVGESGAGKSSLGRAILRLLPRGAEMTARRLRFAGIDLLAASPTQLRQIRGRRIGLIPQDPRIALNPVMTIGAQIAEAGMVQLDLDRAEAQRRTLGMLEAVRIRDPDRVARAYPHELSGGMGQRAMIAMMLIGDPDLLIADEACSALDVTIQLQVLAILDDLVTRRGMGLVFISHDLALVAGFCDRLAVMYGGQILETLAAGSLATAQHPYTRGLVAATPRLHEPPGNLPVLERDEAWLEPMRGSGG